MKRSIWMGMCIGALMGAAAAAELSPGEDSPRVSMEMTEAYLEDVLKLLSMQSGLNFIASEEVRNKTVTVYLDQVPARAALETLLEANRLILKPMEEPNLFLVAESLAPKVATVTRVFQLRYARVVPSAGEILPTFGLTGSLLTPTLTGVTTGGAGVGGGAVAGGGIGGGLGGIAGLGGAQKGGIVQIVQSLLTEHGSVVADPRTNTLIVTEIPQRMQVIEETIANLDVKPVQIFIEAEVLEVTLDTLRRLGIEYGDSAGQIGSYLGPKRTSFFPFSRGLLEKGTISHTLGTFSLADASILFKLLATEKDVKFLARPRLMTLSNEVAEIRIVADAATGVVSTSQATTGTVTENVERHTVGTILRVTPMVNEDRYITMVIEPEISRVIQSSSFTRFLDPNRRMARTTVMAPDGGTVMIAGLISSEDVEGVRRIPGLGDLPIVGLPFKRTETERKNTEILVFLTPRIVREEAPTAVVMVEREQTPLSTKEQRRLAGHRQRILKERAIRDTMEALLK